MEKLSQSKGFYTTNISKEEADKFFDDLYAYSLKFVKDKFPYYVKDGDFVLRAKRINQADKDPRFCVLHHTSNRNQDYRPALHRFMTAKMASSNFLLGRKAEEVLYLVKITDKSFHAVNRVFIPLDVRRRFRIGTGFLNEPGFEIANNGNKYLFSYDQFVNFIVLCRYLRVCFPNMNLIKSHRRFSPISRSGDPGTFSIIPLLQHAAMNDVPLNCQHYWLENYKKDSISVLRNADKIMIELNIDPNEDEWRQKRNSINITDKFLFNSR